MKTFLMRILVILIALSFKGALTAAPSVSPATQAINALGIDLLRATSNTNANALLSPYSIQSALAMTYAGAAGATRDEMEKVLHFPAADSALHSSFAQLRTTFAADVTASEKYAEQVKDFGASPPLVLNVANRLYAQRGYQFKTNFFTLLKQQYGTSFVPVDFKKFALAITTDINEWVEEQTQKRIRNLIPSGALNEDSRLVLVNALYFKASWAESFAKEETKPEPFRIRGGLPENVPTMIHKADFGYMRFPQGQIVALPYSSAFQFVILLPNGNQGLAEFQTKVTPELLQQCASLKDQEVVLHLPRFTFEPPTLKLSTTLKALGMKTAFDQPQGSADFSEIAVRRPDSYLYISDVFHKTFIAVNEEGTEAAAATAVIAAEALSIREPTKPIEVKVDRPFLFAIQHRASGACLFLGQVVDPRAK